jgi:hypothetical protein
LPVHPLVCSWTLGCRADSVQDIRVTALLSAV